MCRQKKKSKLDKATLQWEYEIEPAIGQAQQGSCIVKVWTYAQNIDKAKMQAAKNAVHGILFKGYAASTGETRIPAQRPLVQDVSAETTHSEYFSRFFADGGTVYALCNIGQQWHASPERLDKNIQKTVQDRHCRYCTEGFVAQGTGKCRYNKIVKFRFLIRL